MQNPAGYAAASAAPAVPATPVHAAIARASDETGVDFGYLLAQARLESGLDPRARARTSSATGLYQFTGQTWLRTLARHGADHGLDWAGDAVDEAAGDPSLRRRLLDLCTDPQLSALLAGDLANDNRAALQATLGRAPDNAELYLAHFLGAEGAGRFLAGLAGDPGASAAALLPRAAAANRGIFYQPGGAPRSLGEVMALLRHRLDAAGDAGPTLPYGDLAALGSGWADQPSPLPDVDVTPDRPSGGPLAQAFDRAAGDHGAGAPSHGSMAETLRATFALGGADATAPAAAHVRQAYDRLRAMGL